MASNHLKLGKATVHVWKIVLDRDCPGRSAEMAVLLSTDEANRAARMPDTGDRSRFMAGRAVLRDLAGEYVNRRPESLEFTYGPNGKPLLVGSNLPAHIHFNVSHSGDVILVAFARRDVGVDIEKRRNNTDCKTIARRFFGTLEIEGLDGMPRRLAMNAFYRCWTRKEALVKAMGGGMFRDMKKIVVPVVRRDGTCCISMKDSFGRASIWSIADLGIRRPGYKSAVAMKGAGMTVVNLNWDTDRSRLCHADLF